GRSIVDRDQVPNTARSVERLMELSSWMIVLGTVRMLCGIGDSLGSYLEMAQQELGLAQRLSHFIEENHPIVVLSTAWPLFLGWALRRTRWTEFLRAAAVTFLILSVGGVLALTADWNQTRGKWLTLGSFHVPKYALLHPGFIDCLLIVLGVTQLVLELWTAI